MSRKLHFVSTETQKQGDGDESTSPRILRLRRVAEARGCQGPANDDAAVSTRDNQ